MDSSVVRAACLALALNALSAAMGLDYQWSVVLVFGGMALFYLRCAWGRLGRDDWKLLAGFFVFAEAATLVLEVVMMKFRVWGFGCRVFPLTGWTFLGAPIEEYEYWVGCSVVVPLSYMVFARRLKPASENPLALARLVAWAESLHLRAKSDPTAYVDAEETKPGRFSSGSRFPVYACVQLALAAAIIALARRYHGSWRALLACSLCFLLVAFPHEFRALRMDMWAYNEARMLGPSFLRIPIEGWLMYLLPPVLACMILDVADRDLFGKDV